MPPETVPKAIRARCGRSSLPSGAIRKIHCFRPFPNAPCTADGKVRKEVLAARERGVFFDVGHGKGSFSWKSGRTMLADSR